MKEETTPSKYVILEGIKQGNRFFSINNPDKDQTKLIDGTLAYRIIGYANSTDEAQMKLSGRTWHLDDTPDIYDRSQMIP